MQFQTPEQRSKQLQTAQRSLHTTQEQHAECLQELRRARERMRSIQSGQIPNDPDEKQKRQKAITAARDELDKAMAKRDELRQKIEDDKLAEQSAAQKACVNLVESARPDYEKSFKRFIVARLTSIADEAVALSEVMAIREGLRVALGVRRDSKISRLPFAFDMGQRAEQFARLRQETVELVDAGVIAKKDLPDRLAKAWKIT